MGEKPSISPESGRRNTAKPVLYQFQIKDEIKAARIETTKAYL
jgi:hypothetical protein